MHSRSDLVDWVGENGVPVHPDLGKRFPWRRVVMHGLTRRFRRRVDQARRAIDEALESPIEDWRVGLSCGKDSTVLGFLLAEAGADVRGLSVKDDLDYPGERKYLEQLSRATGLDIEVVEPEMSLRAYLVEHEVSLVEDLHSRAAQLSADHFYGLLEQHRAQSGHDGVFLGLRAKESFGRRMNVATHGIQYTRAYDGLTVCQPLANWSALDVHAALAKRGVPPLPVYLCVDPGVDALKIRKSWWVAGGGPARHGHYVWLERWWPQLYDLAIEIDPAVGLLS